MSNFLDKFQPYTIENYGYVKLPKILITKKQKEDLGLPENVSNLEFCKALCRQGWKERCGHVKKEDYKKYSERINYEISLLDELGFVDYLLLVWMVVNKARELGVFIDYGRGSVGGSTVAWLLKLTGFPVDPIRHELFFERFVSRARAGKKVINGEVFLKGDLLADIDQNLGSGREAIVKWLNEIYPNRVSKISNISTFTTKILLKDVYKSMEEVDEFEAKRISDMVETKFGVTDSVEETYEKNAEFKEWADKYPHVVSACKKLYELQRQTSSHASGYLIGFYELTDSIPLELNKEEELVSGYNMKIVSNFATKLDLLSLTTNAIIKRVVDVANVDVDSLNLDDDPFIYDRLCDGELLPYGLYQISADCAYGVTNMIKPKNVNELSDVSAIARPGALTYASDYKEHTAIPIHGVFADILRPTRNLPLYQEQLMKMSVAVGFTNEEAEIIRKIVGKKDLKKVKEWEGKIYKKCEDSGFEKAVADALWKLLNESASYSFNKAHSLATSYLSALTVYLKYKHPVEWYWSCLIGTKDLAEPTHEITLIQKELEFFGIKLLTPSLYKSGEDYTINGKNILMGLNSIKGVSDKALEKLRSFNRENTNKFALFESFENAKIALSVVKPLILAGCLDDEISSRSKLLLEFELWKLLTPKEKPIVFSLGEKYNYDLFKIVKLMVEELTDEKNRKLIKESRFETIKSKIEPFKQKYYENIKNEDLSNIIFEQNLLGFNYSNTLIGVFSKRVNDLIQIGAAQKLPEKARFKSVCFVDEVEEREQKSGKKSKYLVLTCRDESATLKGYVWGIDNMNNVTKLNGRQVQKGDLIIGHFSRKHERDGYLNEVVIQDCPTVMKVSELKDKE